ncbi:FtsX-like permease family protein [Gemmatimonadota bacterium]
MLGVGLAYAGLDLVKWLQPIASTRLQNATIDGTALVAAAAITILAGFLFGVVPAFKGSRVSILAPLRDEAGGTLSSRGISARGRLVVAQVALSFVLLLTAGVLIRSLSRIQRAEVGFDPHALLTVDVQLPVHKYASPQEVGTAFGLVMERLNALPGLQAVSAVDGLPLFGGMWNGIYRPDQPPDNVGDRLPALRRIAMDGYFATMGIPVLAGREFTNADRDGAQFVTVVSRKLVEDLFPGEEALGKTIVHPWDNSIELEIVGIVGDVADDGPMSDRRPVFYLSFWQHLRPTAQLVLRTDGEPTDLVPAVRAAIHEIEPDMPLTRIGTMRSWMDGNLQSGRMAVGMLGGFALIALLLVAMGLYGVLAYIVSQRTREMGIRMTLGAQPHQVVRTVLRRAMTLTGTGLVLGIAGGFVVASVMQSTLFNASSLDPLIYLAAIAILSAIAVGASIVPAIRAMRVDPVSALRSE